MCLYPWVSKSFKTISAGSFLPRLQNIQICQTPRNWHGFRRAKGKHFCFNCGRNLAGESQVSHLIFPPSAPNELLFLWALWWCQDSVNAAKGPGSSWQVEARGRASSSAGRCQSKLHTFGESAQFPTLDLRVPEVCPQKAGSWVPSLVCVLESWCPGPSKLVTSAQRPSRWNSSFCFMNSDGLCVWKWFHPKPKWTAYPVILALLSKPHYFQAFAQDLFDVAVFGKPLVMQKHEPR